MSFNIIIFTPTRPLPFACRKSTRRNARRCHLLVLIIHPLFVAFFFVTVSFLFYSRGSLLPTLFHPLLLLLCGPRRRRVFRRGTRSTVAYSFPSSSPSTSTAIEGSGISYSAVTRPGKVFPILKDCSLRVPTGELWMLLGPNGCGKSTLLKVLAGVLNPTSGTVNVNGTRSFVFQNPDHQVVMPTVEADVAFGLGKFNLPLAEVKSRVANALESVGMLSYSKRPVQTLSGGQKQRVAIAGALAEACNVLLLDELTTFLDESDQIGVIKAVRDCINGPRNVAAIWVTHRLEELEYADGAICMEDGQIVVQGSVPSVVRYIKDKQATYH